MGNVSNYQWSSSILKAFWGCSKMTKNLRKEEKNEKKVKKLVNRRKLLDIKKRYDVICKQLNLGWNNSESSSRNARLTIYWVKSHSLLHLQKLLHEETYRAFSKR